MAPKMPPQRTVDSFILGGGETPQEKEEEIPVSFTIRIPASMNREIEEILKKRPRSLRLLRSKNALISHWIHRGIERAMKIMNKKIDLA